MNRPSPSVARVALARGWQRAINGWIERRVSLPGRAADWQSPISGLDGHRQRPADSGARSVAPAARFDAVIAEVASISNTVIRQDGFRMLDPAWVLDVQPGASMLNECRYTGATT